jgi:hypothetical protein
MLTIYRERLPFHPLLGRNIHFDSRSLAYALQPIGAAAIVDVRHQSFIGILDQGQLGSCTGNAGCSCIYHAPFFAGGSAKAWPRYSEDESGAVTLYSDATQKDPYSGAYPPDDTGSDGLTVCKVLKAAGDVSGYQASLDLPTSLVALMAGPGVTGIPWYNSMFDTGSSGLLAVNTTSGLAGGHELCVDEVVTAGAVGNGTGKTLVGGPNSWSTSWGASGRWYMTVDDWWSLRKNDGDFYAPVPITQPVPVPVPIPTDDPAGDDLWTATKAWSHENHVGENKRAATAVKVWASKTGRA